MSEPRLDPATTALIVIDLQNGIVALPTAPHAATEVVERSSRLLQAARDSGVLPVLVHVGGAEDGVDRLRQSADEPMPIRQLPPEWSDFIPAMTPRPGEVEIFKRQWGAFYGTDLDLQLRRRGIDTLIYCGIATELGVESSARDAYERNYRQFFVEDAMSGRNEASHHNSTQNIFPRMGHVRDTEWMLEQLKG